MPLNTRDDIWKRVRHHWNLVSTCIDSLLYRFVIYVCSLGELLFVWFVVCMICSVCKHRLITLRNGIGNAIHCQSIIIVSLAYDVIDNGLYRDGHGFFERT